MSYERDFTNDYPWWLETQPPWEQGKPEPPGGTPGPSAPAPRTPRPKPTNPPLPGLMWVYNPERDSWESLPDPNYKPPVDTNTNTTTPPPPTTYYGGVDDGFDGGGEFDSAGFQWPSYTAPAYESAGPFKPRRDTFSYTPFAAPTIEQARQNPGYKFAAEEGVNRLESSAAGRGVLRSGGTLKDIFGWGNKFADQNYDQVYNRDLNTYRTNLDTDFRKFGAEYDIDRDVYDRAANDVQSGNNYRFNASQAEFAPKFDSAKLTFADLYNRWKAKLDSATAIATGGPQ